MNELFTRVSEGMDAGVMSEAGMPGLADPGNMVVEEAHRRAIKAVVPLTGPSSIMLALVCLGNERTVIFIQRLASRRSSGQRRKAIADLERRSATGQTQIFMETPFRE
ncbi:MAG: hypothetical protein MZV63_04095 [Marinilabiliales bacterium]|nr:hypothetical protein [Marinilabiliales bacterium]